MIAGIIYWAAWRVIIPKVFGYELVPNKDTLSDGTVVTVVSWEYFCADSITNTFPSSRPRS